MKALASLLAILLAGHSLVLADDPPAIQGIIVQINEENDKFVKPTTDKHYTQGINISILLPDEDVPFVLRPLQFAGDAGIVDAAHKYGIRCGQSLYTPVNTVTNGFQPDDRPYAGWLYVGAIRENRGAFRNGMPVRDHFEIQLGVVGPWSQADNTQVWFHELIKVARPKGWRHQLENEPGLLIIADRRVRLWDTGADTWLRAQWLANGTAKLGNVETSAGFGSQLRVGHNLPDEFAKDDPLQWGWYIFGGPSGRVVGYNIFLDGNTYQESHSVKKEPAVFAAEGGIVWVLRQMQVSYTYHYTKREFKKQNGYDAYATLNLTYRF